MSSLVDWLETLNARDTRVRAVLRRSLAFEPGAFAASYPYVEPFVGESSNIWRRTALYLAAGLWASHWSEGRGQGQISLGRAAAIHRDKMHQQTGEGLTSTERRFLNLLDADEDQLPHRLRQMIGLLKEQPIDFNALLQGILRWQDDRRPTQTQWARDFYRPRNNADGTPPTSNYGAST